MIFLVSHISKLNILQMSCALDLSSPISPPVLHHVISPQNRRIDDCKGAGHDDSYFGRDVIRCVLSAES